MCLQPRTASSKSNPSQHLTPRTRCCSHAVVRSPEDAFPSRISACLQQVLKKRSIRFHHSDTKAMLFQFFLTSQRSHIHTTNKDNPLPFISAANASKLPRTSQSHPPASNSHIQPLHRVFPEVKTSSSTAPPTPRGIGLIVLWSSIPPSQLASANLPGTGLSVSQSSIPYLLVTAANLPSRSKIFPNIRSPLPRNDCG